MLIDLPILDLRSGPVFYIFAMPFETRNVYVAFLIVNCKTYLKNETQKTGKENCDSQGYLADDTVWYRLLKSKVRSDLHGIWNEPLLILRFEII